MQRYLASTDIIDWQHPAVLNLAEQLAAQASDQLDLVHRSFAWVRDQVRHSHDFAVSVLTCRASDVLRERAGYCYAKSHLLAALLRANGIPAGLCYQRLSRDGNGAPYCLHGLNAVYLPVFGWYRVDPRGNKPGVHAQFTPPVEQLAWPVTLPGEADLPEIWPEPLPVVVEALTCYASADILWEHLPDMPLLAKLVEKGVGVESEDKPHG